MKPLLLIGGGGHCRAAIDVIEACGSFSIKGIVQPKKDGVEPVLGYPVLGDDLAIPSLLTMSPYVLITVGQIKTPAVRATLFNLLRSLNAVLPIVVSPHAYVSRHVTIGDGGLVMHGAIINSGARIGLNVIVNTLALLEHDVQVGDHCHISTGARVNGGVQVESGCFIGSGAVIVQGIRIGAGSVIGAGCIVTRNVAENTVMKART